MPAITTIFGRLTHLLAHSLHTIKSMGLRFVAFVDGTVAGTDISSIREVNQTKDRTYYGNGCPNAYDTSKPNYGGSTVSCQTSIVDTVDGETQKIGTYYSFAAATSGTGGSTTSGVTNSTDTFCPLGWQLPYGGTGGDYYDKSRSWKYLLTQYNILDDGSNITVLQSYPLSYIRSGNSIAYSGILLTMGIQGFYWSISYNSLQLAFRFDFWYSGFKNNENVDKAHDQPLRCV